MGQINIPSELISQFCRQNHIRRLALFGSVLRSDFNAASDIDVLVEFLPESQVGMLGLARMQRELTKILGGRTVDLRTPAELSRYFRDDVIRAAEVCYEA
jgi:predicted nucleotidyltransferase